MYSIPYEILVYILRLCIADRTPSLRQCLIYVCKSWYSVIINHIQLFIDDVASRPGSTQYNYLPAQCFDCLTFEQKIKLANERELQNDDALSLARLKQCYRISWCDIFEYVCCNGKTIINESDIEYFPKNASTYFINLMDSNEQFRRDVLAHVPRDILDRMIKHYAIVVRRLHYECSDTLYNAVWQYLNANSPSTIVYRIYDEHTRLRRAL